MLNKDSQELYAPSNDYKFKFKVHNVSSRLGMIHSL